MDRPVIGVVGLGTMGLGIAQVFAQAGHRVIATDALEPARVAAPERLRATLARRVDGGKLPADDAAATLSRFIVADDVSAFGEATLIIEAVVERIDIKQALFRALEEVVAPDAVLATNTSSLSVEGVAAGLIRPDRLVGLHFFNPAPAMHLVEIVAHRRTDPRALDLARRLTEAAGKTVIPCPDRPGFIVNRCARPFYGEALALLTEGRTAAEIDAAILTAGYRMGPFALIDLIGADVNLIATETIARAMGGHPRYHLFHTLREAVARGRLGVKSGAGFLHPAAPGAPPTDAASIVLRIEATLVNEAAFLVGDGGDEAAIDRAMMLGLNFPHGPFAAARRQGLSRIRETLAALEVAAPPHLKTRYKTAPYLEGLT